MKKTLFKLILVLSWFFYCPHGQAMQEAVPDQQESAPITTRLLSPKEDQETVKLVVDKMVDSFLEAYRDIPIEDLRISLQYPNKRTWLEDTFIGELKSFLLQKTPIHWMIATREGQIVGAVIFEPYTQQRIHCRQMAQFTQEGRQKIGTHLAADLRKFVAKQYPQSTSAIANVRLLNKVGIAFIQSLGFKRAEDPFDGYPKVSYDGWILD
ncbi:MAG: hypothetical protein K2Y18_05040 [Alphaproteobacteria bacterium]|nr:hypothetical protein [Alphaproteobacteria bacterium]